MKPKRTPLSRLLKDYADRRIVAAELRAQAMVYDKLARGLLKEIKSRKRSS